MAKLAAVTDRTRPAIGVLLQRWRGRRRLSQLELSVRTGVSARHLSCIETGRSEPSRDMVLRLAEALDVPLREHNALLLAAGYAPAWTESALSDERLAPVDRAVEMILDNHEPYPAVAVDRRWNIVAANRGLAVLTEEAAPELLTPPVNVARAALHPDGLGPRLRNFAEVRDYFLHRMPAHYADDPQMRALYAEIAAAEPPPGAPDPEPAGEADPVTLPLRLTTRRGELALFTTVVTFGAALDVTVSELSIELFFPLDEATAEAFRNAAEADPIRDPESAPAPSGGD